MSDQRSPTFENVLRRAMESHQMDLHTALPGVVESYDSARQVANVKPLIKRNYVADDVDTVEALPVINDVPVVFPRGGGFFISFPLAKGDHVLLVFNERSIDKWQVGSGGDTDPVDLRMHNLSDAVAHAGFYPDGKALSSADGTDMNMGDDAGMQLKITKAGTVEIGDGAKSAVKQEDLKLQYDPHVHPTAFGPTGITTPLTGAEKSATLKLDSL